MKTTYIIVRTSFVALHSWEHAKGNVKFLNTPHRHKFGVKIHIEVDNLDRQLEFFTVLDRVNELLKLWEVVENFKESCESFADRLVTYLLEWYGEREYRVEVSEDGENSGYIEYTPKKPYLSK